MKSKVCTVEEAVEKYVKSGDFIALAGFGASTLAMETVICIREKFLATGEPNKLGIMSGGGQLGLDFFAEDGFLEKLIVGHYGPNPKIAKMAGENKFLTWNIPQGLVGHLLRAITNGDKGLVTKCGLNTYMDPRLEGGRMNDVTTESITELIDVCGEEYLYYKAPKIDVALLRATAVDEYGNVSFYDEMVTSYAKYAAMAAKACGGKVIVECRDIVAGGSMSARDVDLAGIFVDAVVQIQDTTAHYFMTPTTVYSKALTGAIKVPVAKNDPVPLNPRKLIGRRAAIELPPDAVVNIGIGVPEMVSAVAEEEGVLDQITLTVEAGLIGGSAAKGEPFGTQVNHDCVNDEPTQFDFYHSGLLDICFLGLAQVGANGDVNVSKFGPIPTGCGGFIDISQYCGTVVYCGTFTAGGLKERIEDGKLIIDQEGRNKKFVNEVMQVSFSAKQAIADGVKVLYITERAVFELTPEGVELIEVAPGVDLQKDILDLMDFEPIMKDVKPMDAKLFDPALMGLKEIIEAK